MRSFGYLDNFYVNNSKQKRTFQNSTTIETFNHNVAIILEIIPEIMKKLQTHTPDKYERITIGDKHYTSWNICSIDKDPSYKINLLSDGRLARRRYHFDTVFSGSRMHVEGHDKWEIVYIRYLNRLPNSWDKICLDSVMKIRYYLALLAESEFNVELVEGWINESDKFKNKKLKCFFYRIFKHWNSPIHFLF